MTAKPLETARQEADRSADKLPISTAGSFAYSKLHPPVPLSASLFAAMREPDDVEAFKVTPQASVDVNSGKLNMLSSRSGVCSAVASAAQAYELPIPFFANLIWQESSFQSKTVSSAGALGIAQFMPETAVSHGLMNPFEPIHALFTAGKHLRKLNEQFGNLGLAAAAYNAGPQRVRAWMAQRKTLPSETRAYVMQITGRPAEQWLSSEIQRDPEALLMPAKAPCAEVAVALEVQAEVVRIAKLMAEFAKLADAQAPGKQADTKPADAKPAAEKLAAEKAGAEKPATEKPKQARSAPALPSSAIGLSLFPRPPQHASWPAPKKAAEKPAPVTPALVKPAMQKPAMEKRAAHERSSGDPRRRIPTSRGL